MLIKRLGDFFLDIIEVIVFAIAIFLFIYLLLVQPHKIKGDSMQPNYPNGEYLLTDKVTYRFKNPQRGDVIVFEAPGTNGDEYIKRIIGLPGEKIKIFQEKVYINGNPLKEDYLNQSIRTDPGSFLKDSLEVVIPPNNFIALGDNRNASSDSRAWGFVPKENIRGRAWFIYWPINSIGTTKHVTYNI